MLVLPDLVSRDSRLVSDPTQDHPFLLVKRERFAELRDRARSTPWREIRNLAIDAASKLEDDPSQEIRARSVTLARALSVNSLAYILDPDKSTMYASRIVELAAAFDGEFPGSLTRLMRDNTDKTMWTHAVPTGNAYVHAVLALDVVHDELETRDLARVESVLREGPAAYFRDTELAWYQGSWAARAIWPVYCRDAFLYAPIVEAWRRDVLRSISRDGVFTGGTGYASARWTNPDREHKALFGEILSHTGILPSWHDEPQMQAFQEWFTGYAHTPFGTTWTIGDGSPSSFASDEHTGVENASNYSPLAGGYAAALLKNKEPAAMFSTYVLTRQWPLEPVAAPSRVFPDGGAWLKQTSLDPNGLALVLYNLSDEHDAHAHKETNSLGMAAYGELLLRAGGYNGWSTGEAGFSWDYIHSRAIAGNVALIDYAVPSDPESERSPSPGHDHRLRHGAGITGSLLTGHLDYACGDSGDALPNGRHLRNLVLVHPADGVAGYAITVDEFHAAVPGTSGQLVWHPASDAHSAMPDGAHNWRISQSTSGVDLTVFLATPPQATTEHDGVLASWGAGIVGRYLVAHYATEDDGSRSVVTVLFPRQDGQAPAVLDRLTSGGGTGARIRQGEIVDVVWESAGSTVVEPCSGVRARARAGLVRHDGEGRLLGLWVKDATLVEAGALGFASEHPVTLVQRGGSVQVISEGGELTVRHPNLSDILIGGRPAPSWAIDSGSRRVLLPRGCQTLNCVTAAGSGLGS